MSSIYRKLVVYFLLLNLFAIGSVGVYSYYKEKTALLTRTFDQLVSVRLEKKNRILTFFKQRTNDMENICRLPEIQKMLSRINSPDSDSYQIKDKKIFKRYHKYLIDYLDDAECYKRLIFFSASTKAYAIDVKASDNKYYALNILKIRALQKLHSETGTSRKTFVKEWTMNLALNRPELLIGKNIFDANGLFSGIVILIVRPSAINAIMFENNPNNGLGKTGEVYLVGYDSLMRSTSRFLENSVYKIKVRTKGVYRALKGFTGRSQFKDYRNIPVLSSYSPLVFSNLRWVILAEIDTKEAMIPIYSIRDNIIYLSLLIALIAASIIAFFSKKFSNPIKKLKTETTRIASGEYGNILKVETKDEIGELTNYFNKMSVKLKVQANKLEEEKKKRLRSVIDAEEEERQRLSRELHDGLGQMLLAGKMKLESALNAKEETLRIIIKEAMQIFSSTAKEIRNISNNLMPSVLKEFGLQTALQNLCKEVMDTYPIKIHLLINLKREHYPRNIEIYLFRITQEAINNTLKHADANYIHLSLEEIDSNLFFTLLDDGNGFLLNDQNFLKGNGLGNMKERVNLLNGNLELTSSQLRGTKIDIIIPLE